MKPRRAAFTLVELLASMAIAAMIGLLLHQFVSAQQLALQGALKQEGLSSNRRRIVHTLRAALDQALPPLTGPSVENAAGPLVIAPASTLLRGPEAESSSGHAVFFQAPSRDSDGLWRRHSHGFAVVYGDDSAWRPGFLRRANQAFRLLYWRDGGESLRALENDPTSNAWVTATTTRQPIAAADQVLGLWFEQVPNGWRVLTLVAHEPDWRRLAPQARDQLAKSLRTLAECSHDSAEVESVVRRISERCHAAKVRVERQAFFLGPRGLEP